jgi:hypothetical protein
MQFMLIEFVSLGTILIQVKVNRSLTICTFVCILMYFKTQALFAQVLTVLMDTGNLHNFQESMTKIVPIL